MWFFFLLSFLVPILICYDDFAASLPGSTMKKILLLYSYTKPSPFYDSIINMLTKIWYFLQLFWYLHTSQYKLFIFFSHTTHHMVMMSLIFFNSARIRTLLLANVPCTFVLPTSPIIDRIYEANGVLRREYYEYDRIAVNVLCLGMEKSLLLASSSLF